jgi:hypothetical protein
LASPVDHAQFFQCLRVGRLAVRSR